MSLNKPTVKLFTLWMCDNEEQPTPSSHFISHGIWQTQGVEIRQHDNGRQYRVYTLVCAWPMHRERKVGDKIKMAEEVIVLLCHQVKIEHLAKDVWPT